MLKTFIGAAALAFVCCSLPALAAKGTLITCENLTAVDGDTIKCDGVNMRDMGDGEPFISGYDTPEIRGAKCPEEKAMGKRARNRMAQLLKSPGLRIYHSGQHDGRYKRPLVWLVLGNQRSIGSVLISEGLARIWTPAYVANWCAPKP